MKLPNGARYYNWVTWVFAGLITLSVISCAKPPEVVQKVPPPPEIPVEPQKIPELDPMERWEKLVRDNMFEPVDQKLAGVNEFFNHFDFVEDYTLWGMNDYWATLFETLQMNGGDCEDFTIAKYFTLRELNIPDENMRLTYVISLKTKQPHMVLTLQKDSSEEPIVLDSVNNYLFPVSKRQDLVPVFSFNENGYWLSRKQKGWKGERVGGADKLSLWRNVLQRMRLRRSGATGS